MHTDIAVAGADSIREKAMLSLAKAKRGQRRCDFPLPFSAARHWILGSWHECNPIFLVSPSLPFVIVGSVQFLPLVPGMRQDKV